MVSSAAMRTNLLVIVLLGTSALQCVAADKAELQERRQRAATAFHDGVLLVHANSRLEIAGDGFRQDAAFYYFTGLENTVGALLAIDGRSGQSWLFLVSDPPFSKIQPPEVSPGSEAANRSGVDHVVDFSALLNFLAQHATSPSTLYYLKDWQAVEELPSNLASEKAPEAPLWAVTLAAKWPSFELKEAHDRVYALMTVQSQSEMASVRAAAKATVAAVLAGMRTIRPGVSQRTIEAAVENTCWHQGAHGSSFWPWAMAGENGVFPHPFSSLARYDHLDAVMHSGDLVRLDVGCESDHYQGDLGRTVPVSGHYSDEQHETWNIFVAAYQAGVKSLHEGVTPNQVFKSWSGELLRHREAAKTAMARHAIDSWSKRENVPFWQLHTMNLDAGSVGNQLRAGSTIAFEPIASVDGQGFYLEDLFLVGKQGTELLTPGVPYSAEEIEAAMR
ncbi:MAG: aminopeptidase P N-terminal domain-containing protein [Acidobacteriia bacterium]|nr:aminopeptidase P N-terminal domain-containing protein [Terriglobia bacterium]